MFQISDKIKKARCVALVFQIVAIEVYNTGGKLIDDLKAVVDELISGHLTDWSDFVLNSLPTAESVHDSIDLSITQVPCDDTGDVKLLLSGKEKTPTNLQCLNTSEMM